MATSSPYPACECNDATRLTTTHRCVPGRPFPLPGSSLANLAEIRVPLQAWEPIPFLQLDTTRTPTLCMTSLATATLCRREPMATIGAAGQVDLSPPRGVRQGRGGGRCVRSAFERHRIVLVPRAILTSVPVSCPSSRERRSTQRAGKALPPPRTTRRRRRARPPPVAEGR
jgi:hypothetical protein